MLCEQVSYTAHGVVMQGTGCDKYASLWKNVEYAMALLQRQDKYASQGVVSQTDSHTVIYTGQPASSTGHWLARCLGQPDLDTGQTSQGGPQRDKLT
jgi:hypothetical protein